MGIHSEEYPTGIIAGGMADGTLNVWDTSKIIAGEDSEDPLMLSAEGHHSGAVTGLQFNPHKGWGHSLASGGSDGEVLVMSLEKPDAPATYTTSDSSKHSGEVTKVAWNTGTHYILASSDNKGSTCVWDMKQRKLWCEIRDPTGGAISDIAWGPDGGTNIITASGDDRNPVLKYWDLRSSTSLPLATLKGHTEGILSVSWCPSDPFMLMSTGKDNRTIIWDLLTTQPVYELPSDSVAGSMESEANIFGGVGATNAQKRYQASWSPNIPAVAATASFDRRVQFYSLSGFKSTTGRAPKWLRKPAGATFGFGGKLVTFGSSAGDSKGKPSVQAKIHQIIEDNELIASCDKFHKFTAAGDQEAYKNLCDEKVKTLESDKDKEIWGMMKVICFEQNARENLQTFLGFDGVAVKEAADKYVAEAKSAEAADNSVDNNNSDPSKYNALTTEMLNMVLAGKKAEPTIREAVVVGNFSAAVDCCIEAGLMAEALLLAQCGDQNLWLKTQAAFFETQKSRHPFLSILHAIVKNELMNYVQESNLDTWRETLAVIGTYGKSEQFPDMCEELGKRLETELQDLHAATLCYMCAANVERTVSFWTEEFKKKNAAKGYLDTKALQEYIEKVEVFTHANPGKELGDEAMAFFATYAGLLAAQGRLVEAPKYLQRSKSVDEVLSDRLYHAGKKAAGSKPPNFPFTRSVVNYCAPVIPESQKANVAENNNTGTSTTSASTTSESPFDQPANSSSNGSSGMSQAISNAASAQNQPAVSAAPAAKPGLPAGWVEMQDPTSGRPYFVNQATNQSQWEAPPLPVAAPAIAQQNFVPNPAHSVVHTQQVPMAAGGANVMQTNIQSAVVEKAAEVSTPVVEKPTIDAAAVQSLGAIVATLAANATPVEKRQLTMINTGFNNLEQKAASGAIAPEIMSKIESIVTEMNNRNFPAALQIQGNLADTVWAEHSAWIKAVKMLITICSKK